MKASALSGQWHVDAAELESKVLGEGGGRNIGDRNVKEVMRLAPEKKGLAQRLLEQYANDYESSRGTSGDIRLVAATQRSGTAKDKVAAFTCMVDDNPIANVRSLDALLGMVFSFYSLCLELLFLPLYLRIQRIPVTLVRILYSRNAVL